MSVEATTCAKNDNTLSPERRPKISNQLIAEVIKVVSWKDLNPKSLMEGGCVWDNGANISYVSRQTANDCGVDSSLFQIAGTPTALSSVTGPIAFINAMARRDECGRIGYASGHTDNTIDAGRGIVQTLFGLDFLIYRPTTFMCMASNIGCSSIHTTALGAVSFMSGLIGGALFGVFSVFIGVYVGRKIHKNSKFFSDIEKNTIKLSELKIEAKSISKGNTSTIKEDVKEKAKDFLKAIEGKLSDKTSTDEVLNSLKEKFGIKSSSDSNENISTEENSSTVLDEAQSSDSTQELPLLSAPNTTNEPINKLKQHLGEQGKTFKKSIEANLKKLLKDEKVFKVLKSQDNQQGNQNDTDTIILREVLKKFNAGIDVKGLAKLYLNSDELLGLIVEVCNREASRAAKVTDAIGSEAVGLIKKGMLEGLSERLISDNEAVSQLAFEELSKILELVDKEKNFSSIVNWLYIASCLACVVATVGSFLAAPHAAFVSGVFFTITAVGMFVADAFPLLRTLFSSDSIDTRDKWIVKQNIIIAVVCLIISIVAVSFFSAGTVPLAISFVVLALWIINGFYSLGQLSEREKRSFIENPTLETLSKILENNQIQEGDATTYLQYIGKFLRTYLLGEGTYTISEIHKMIEGLSESERKSFEEVLLEQLKSQQAETNQDQCAATLKTTNLEWGSSSCNDKGEIIEGEQKKLTEFLKLFISVEQENTDHDKNDQKIAKEANAPSKEEIKEFIDAVSRVHDQNKNDKEVAQLYVQLKKLQADNQNQQGLQSLQKSTLTDGNLEKLKDHIFVIKAKTLSQRAIKIGALGNANLIKTVAQSAFKKQEMERQAIFDSFGEREVEVIDPSAIHSAA